MYALIFALATPAAPPADDTPSFVFVSQADDNLSGRLVQLTPEFTATVKARLGETVVKDVIAVRRSGMPLPPFPVGPHLITATGDRIVGSLAGGDPGALRFTPAADPRRAWKVPLPSAAALWLTAMPADTPPDPARYDWPGETRNRDVLRFRNGDTARGVLGGLDPDLRPPVFEFRPDGGTPRSVPASELTAIAFNPLLARTRKPKGPYARVVLTDGSRLDLTGPSVLDGVLTGDALFGQKVALPLDAVVGLDVMQGKATDLSDLKPKKFEQGGFLGTGWAWAADRNVHGMPLQLATAVGDATADKGLGTHPRTILTYELGGKYRRFEAVVGIAPGGDLRSRAAVRVLVDGKEQDIPGLGELTTGPAVPVRVGLKGARELTLVVDFGPGAGVKADVNWGDARLIAE